MAKGNFAQALADVLVHEGGYVDHPKDPGGATNKGITLKTLAAWRKVSPWWALPKAEVKNLTSAEVAAIYEANYWRPIRGDELPSGVDLSTMDYGVNSGPARSAKDLQRVVGVTVDGRIGPATILATKAADARTVIKGHCARRMSFLRSLAIWNTFGKGWSTRVANVEAKALSWVSSKAQLEADAKDAAGKAVGQGAGAGGVVGSGTVDQVNGLSGLPIGFVVAAVVIVGGILIIRTIINAQRASALSAVAKEA